MVVAQELYLVMVVIVVPAQPSQSQSSQPMVVVVPALYSLATLLPKARAASFW